MRVAVVGGGISGLVPAYILAKAGANVVLYEKQDYLGGHAKTVKADGVDLDLGFMVFNQVTYPDMMEFFESIGVDMELSDMSFSVSLDNGRGCEWSNRNGLSSLFAQKRNVFNPYFWQMIREMIKFKEDVLSYLDILENNQGIDRNDTLGQFIKSRRYSELFQKAYLIPICSSIWSCPFERVMSFSAFSVLSFCRNHHLLQLFDCPQRPTVRWLSKNHIEKVKEEFMSKSCEIKLNCEVNLVSTSDKGCVVTCKDGSQEMYDGCIMAVHVPDALRILGDEATSDEHRILGAFQYVYCDIFLHRDKNLMPQNQEAWSTWNFLGTTDNNRVSVTYWLNILQSNELFQLFLDERMQYSCAVFKNEDEDLKDAQMRKISVLIVKARIDRKHEILEIGCGWGGFAIEVVKQTGCKYTGITLSEEQLKFAEKKVEDAGLQDHIKFLLCDYRQLPKTNKYDRIISCEMIEAVGHEYMEEFFGCCDSALADDGLLVLQFTSIPDERYEGYRKSSEFIKEYIFPGCCIPSLSMVTSAMSVASRLCVEHVENIGIHFYRTLILWRKNFLENKCKILALGFDEKFIRMWEYYFDYCGAGFKSRTLGNYQMVFSRPGNITAFSNPYKSLPSAC